ncbi:hypothetical protein [Oryzibacter oryziterrae]|uniref:hypothetical protein n=1 Tax=Oryzibacter oryziterrae TaxID=2766474 RepID=UPI001F22DBB8|nr:hypothetical protein [Oryzibacter oryziterrae]
MRLLFSLAVAAITVQTTSVFAGGTVDIQAGSPDIKPYLALWEQVNPNIVKEEGNNLQSMVYCNLQFETKNEFELRDAELAISDQIHKLSPDMSGYISNLKYTVYLGRYDFDRHGFPTLMDQYPIKNRKLIANIKTPKNDRCWHPNEQGRGGAMFERNNGEIYWWPGDNEVPEFIPVEEKEARTLVEQSVSNTLILRISARAKIDLKNSGTYDYKGSLENVTSYITSLEDKSLMDLNYSELVHKSGPSETSEATPRTSSGSETPPPQAPVAALPMTQGELQWITKGNVASLNIPHTNNDGWVGEFVKIECDKEAEGNVGLSVMFMGAHNYDGKWLGSEAIVDGSPFSVPTFCGTDEGGPTCWLKLTRDAASSMMSSESFAVQVDGHELVNMKTASAVKSVVGACTGKPVVTEAPAPAKTDTSNTPANSNASAAGWQIADSKNGKLATLSGINPGVDLKISCAGPKALRYQFDGHGTRVSDVTLPNADEDIILKPDVKGYLSNGDATRFIKEIANVIEEVKTYGAYDPNAFSTPIYVNGEMGVNSVLGDITKVREIVRSSCPADMPPASGGSSASAASCADKLHTFYQAAEDNFMSSVKPSVSIGYFSRFCAYAPAFINAMDATWQAQASCPPFRTKYPKNYHAVEGGASGLRQTYNETCG